jgi:rubrerythrin
MSIALSMGELLNIAIGIERQGIAFYDTMARSVGNTATGETFQYLADMERRHLQLFQDMLSETGDSNVSESYSEEQAGYLKGLVESAVFSDEMASSEMLNHAESDVSSLETAISAEKDSILFYYEMRDIVPRNIHQMVEQIMNEEKLHLRQLAELKKKLVASKEE